MTELTKAELKEFQAKLIEIRARIKGDVKDLTEETLGRDHGESRTPTHPAELGSETYEQDFSLSLIRNEEEVLEDISAALARLESGEYGVCLKCLEAGKPVKKSMIPKARLKAIPWAKNCVECERQREIYG